MGDACGPCMLLFKRITALVGLVVAFVALFSVGTLFLPPALRNQQSGSESAAALGLLAVAIIDVAFIAGVVLTSRLRGAPLWLLTSAVYWGAKTFTSQLEAWYFMPNVNAALVPSLMLMTVPVALGVPLLAVLLLGRWKGPTESPALRVPPMSAGQQAWKWALLSAVIYPVLFFVAGYFVAFSNAEVRAFYGGVFEDTFFAHMRAVLTADPRLYPFEVLRGALWVAMGVALLWTTRGRAWVGGLWVVLLFSLVQNDVHVMPNPLMSPTVQLFHFVETASSNALFAVLITWLMHRAHFESGAHRPAGTGRMAHGT